MQTDSVIWEIINKGHCSFKVKTVTQTFCRNDYNITGMCNKSSCPLANSNYATVIEDKGKLVLYIKTIERQHLPSKLWEKIPLDKNYAKALEQIDGNLMYWNKFIIHKCKQRLTKQTEMLRRMRKLKLRGIPELTVIKKKQERRDKIREIKAHAAANLEGEIESELLSRQEMGTYGEIYNYKQNVFLKNINKRQVADDEEEFNDEIVSDEDELIQDDNDIEYLFNKKHLNDENDSDEEPSEDDGAENNEDLLKKRDFDKKDLKRTLKKKIKKGKVELEWQDDDLEEDLEKQEMMEGLKDYSF